LSTAVGKAFENHRASRIATQQMVRGSLARLALDLNQTQMQ